MMPAKTAVDNAGYYHTSYKYNSISRLHKVGKMHGARRVIMFCLLIAVLPTLLIIIPLYLRNSLFSDTILAVTESDVIEITEGISSVFCQRHTLRMNTTFNAFQLSTRPEIGNNHKHIRLKKSMVLPDDTLEYWGFYLLKGAVVKLKVCSRFEGSRILVVRGQRHLHTCGLLDQDEARKIDPNLANDYQQVQVTFETVAQEILSRDEDLENAAREVTNTADQEEELFPKRRAKSSTSARHKRRHLKKEQRLERQKRRLRRDLLGGKILDGRVEHGGNAGNHSEKRPDSSMSSFENSLLTCFDGRILLTRGFDPSHLCDDVHYLDRIDHLNAVHNVTSDGYYYYIFYSDNDLVKNDIHAVFDIFKPTYQYTNISRSKQCINRTECSFPIPFWSEESVVVEVATRDGIDHEEDDITYLVSTCQPRKSVYVVFPVAVLFLILACAFL